MKLDIACGQSKQEGFHGVDIAEVEGVDTVHDLTQFPWPFKDGSVEEAFCSHYVEHTPQTVMVETDEREYVIRDGEKVYAIDTIAHGLAPKHKVATDGLIAFMNEVHRILKPDAQIRIVHPHLRSDRAFQDPTHLRFIPEAGWHYYDKTWREANKLDHYPIKSDYEITQMFYNGFQGDWGQRSEQARQFALQHYWNVAVDLVVDLKARK